MCLCSTTAVLFQIKMRVCIVPLPVTKGPPLTPCSTLNCSFWNVLLGYRPAWRWILLCMAFVQLYSSSIMSNLLCMWCSCAVSVPAHLICVCVSVCVWIFARSVQVCLCRARPKYDTDSFLSNSPFVRWTLRSQSCCRTRSLQQLTPQAVHKESIVSASCSITLQSTHSGPARTGNEWTIFNWCSEL